MTAGTTTSTSPVQPAARLRGMRPYDPPASPWPIDLYLDANEGRLDEAAVRASLDEVDIASLSRYPSASALEAAIATRLGTDANRVVVTNGGDDAIDRVCRAVLDPGTRALTHAPTFVMIAHSARLAGATVNEVPWVDGDFPTDEFIERIDDATKLVALVTPNNPTGRVVPLADIRAVALAAAGVGAALLVDLAYVEFADEDPTPALLELANVVMIRTFSKARGLAGLRIGYAVASAEMAVWLRTTGGPYPVSRLSLELAAGALDPTATSDGYVQRVRDERGSLIDVLRDCGGEPIASEANFVLTRVPSRAMTKDTLASLGIGVRDFPGREPLDDCLRITLPGHAEDFDRLTRGLRAAMAPEALLLDMDGVIADVSSSYREAITATASTYGVQVDRDAIVEIKHAGNANNDWEVTLRVLEAAGITTTIEEVVRRFQDVYLGRDGQTGLRERESLIPSINTMRRLVDRLPLAIVTGRPREEAAWFLERFDLASRIPVLVAMEDGPAKPDPAPVIAALEQLGVSAAWMVGDTPDDMVAARAAGVVPVGVVAPGERTETATAVLQRSGAVRVMNTLDELPEMLP